MNLDTPIDPDNFQQAWRTQSARTHVTVDADRLLSEVQRSERQFRAMVFWRDFREVFIAMFLIPIWFYMGATTSPPWTWYLSVPALIFTAGFMLVFRWRHPHKASEPDESLRECAKNSLTHVDDQIWLLRNVLWWYLLPLGTSIAAFFIHVAVDGAIATNDWVAGLFAAAIGVGILVAVYYSIYYLNQFAVRKQLEPRRQELLALLASLSDETTGGVSGEYPILTGAKCGECPPRRILVANLCAVAIVLVSVLGVVYFVSNWATSERVAEEQVVEVAPEVLEKFVGVFAISPQFALTITLEGDQLMVQSTGQQRFPLLPKSETHFYSKDIDAQLHFVADHNGNFNYVVLYQNGEIQTATRKD
jgi:hypothetical protein